MLLLTVVFIVIQFCIIRYYNSQAIIVVGRQLNLHRAATAVDIVS